MAKCEKYLKSLRLVYEIFREEKIDFPIICWLFPSLESFAKLFYVWITILLHQRGACQFSWKINFLLHESLEFFCRRFHKFRMMEKLTFYQKLNPRSIVLSFTNCTSLFQPFYSDAKSSFIFFLRYSWMKIIAERIRVFDKHFSLLYAFYSTDCVYRLLSHSML